MKKSAVLILCIYIVAASVLLASCASARSAEPFPVLKAGVREEAPAPEETEQPEEQPEKIVENDQPVVMKERLNIILIAGQSNAASGSGKLDSLVISPEPGNGFVWNTARDGEGDASEESPLTDMAEYIITRGTTDCVGTSIGFYPALAAEWYELTGEKAVIIEAGYPGCSIDKWSSYGWTEQDVGRIDSCVKYIRDELSDKYEIVGGGYYWLQGESDSSLYSKGSGVLCYKTPGEYEELFLDVHNSYISAFKDNGIPDPYCGIVTCRGWSSIGSGAVSEYCGVRAAQQHLANVNTEITMASVLPDTFLRYGEVKCSYSSLSGRYCVTAGSAGAYFDVVHYGQCILNFLGLDAADSVFRATREGISAEDFTVYGNNAVTCYESGDTIHLSDNMRTVGSMNPGEKNAAQLVFCPEPFCGGCDGIRMELAKQSDGTPVPLEDIMDESGYIPDVRKLTEPLTLTVTLAGASKTFTLMR